MSTLATFLAANPLTQGTMSEILTRDLPAGCARKRASVCWRWSTRMESPEWSVCLHDTPHFASEPFATRLDFDTTDADAAWAAYERGAVTP